MYFCTFLLALFTLVSGFADLPGTAKASEETKNKPIVGAGTYGAIILNAIETFGQVRLKGTIVTQYIQLQGSLIADSAQIGSLEVVGEADLSHTLVKAAASIIGSLHAQNTTFLQPLDVTSNRMVFTLSKLHSLTIRQNLGFKGKQIVELRQGTLIEGPVVFEGGKGEIHLFSGSQVLGTVTGGKIVRK